jgi:hypothetical protein
MTRAMIAATNVLEQDSRTFDESVKKRWRSEPPHKMKVSGK